MIPAQVHEVLTSGPSRMHTDRDALLALADMVRRYLHSPKASLDKRYYKSCLESATGLLP